MSASNALDRILQQSKPTPVEPESEELEFDAPDPDTYQAFSKGKQGGRRGELGLLLYYADGETVVTLYYAYLMRVVAASPEILYLMCTDCVYTVYGNNLMPLMPLLRDHKIIYLQAFNEQKHPALTADNDEMVIESIIMESTAVWWEGFDKREAIRQKEDLDA